jgi:hypothetical protein
MADSVYTVLTVGIHMISSFYMTSMGYIAEYKRQPCGIYCGIELEQTHNVMTINSLRPIKFRVGFGWHMEKKTKLAFVHALLYVTGKLLIAFK